MALMKTLFLTIHKNKGSQQIIYYNNKIAINKEGIR